MSLSSLQLDAFLAVARSRSFSAAASQLHITQSALSQRILNLEEDLEQSLFVRDATGARLTETGERLLRYCQTKELLEGEFMGTVGGRTAGPLSGLARIAGFSTFVRSRLIPKLGKFHRAHPEVLVEILSREVRDLLPLLRSAQADFIFTLERIDRQDLECIQVAEEENVLVKSRRHAGRENVFIDHDPFDTTTADFWKQQKSAPKSYRRVYFDEIYAVIDAVAEGFGQAVVPLHLVEGRGDVKVVKGLRSHKVPVYLVYFKQAYYTRLQRALIEAL